METDRRHEIHPDASTASEIRGLSSLSFLIYKTEITVTTRHQTVASNVCAGP